MPEIIQSHSFAPENSNIASKVLIIGGGVALASSNLLAVDPIWYTNLQTELTWLTGAVIAVLGVVIGIRLAPLAWVHIKRVLYR